MYNPDTDLLFPLRALPELGNLRGSAWRGLVSSVVLAGENSLEQISFTLMMARMNNCATCNSDSYRAMNGCTVCAKQSLKRYHENDDALIQTFDTTKGEVETYLHEKTSFHTG
jgi:predicted peroxiredoxin